MGLPASAGWSGVPRGTPSVDRSGERPAELCDLGRANPHGQTARIAPAVRSSRIKRPRPVRRCRLFVRPKLCQPRRCQSAPAPRRDRDPARGAIPTACVAPSTTSCRATSDRRQERSSFFHRATALGFISRLGANPIRLPADLTRTRSRGPQGYRSAPKSPRRIGRRLRPAAAAGGCPTSSSAAQSKSRRPLS